MRGRSGLETGKVSLLAALVRSRRLGLRSLRLQLSRFLIVKIQRTTYSLNHGEKSLTFQSENLLNAVGIHNGHSVLRKTLCKGILTTLDNLLSQTQQSRPPHSTPANAHPLNPPQFYSSLPPLYISLPSLPPSNLN